MFLIYTFIISKINSFCFRRFILDFGWRWAEKYFMKSCSINFYPMSKAPRDCAIVVFPKYDSPVIAKWMKSSIDDHFYWWATDGDAWSDEDCYGFIYLRNANDLWEKK